VTIDKWDINLDGAIGQLLSQTIVNNCYNSAGHNSSSLCQYVIRDASNQITRVEALFINLANQRVRGLDLELNFSGINVAGGTLSWRLLGSQLDENSVLTPGTLRDERAGDLGSAPPGGGLPKKKFTTSLRYAHGPVSVFLQERYIGGGVNDHTKVEATTRLAGLTTIESNTVSSVMYTDLTFSFTGGKSGATPWETFLTVNNLTNKAPPSTYQVVGRAGVAGPNTYLYDTLGRRFTAGVRVNF
jgi:iron complex outermembrane recepter protein